MARPYLTEAQVAEQRNRLISAALALYRTQGYEAVTLRALAAELGMSHVTPYRYFESKDDLFVAIRAEVFTHFALHLEAADDPRLRPVERVRRLCLGVVDFAWQFPEDYRLIFSLRQPPATDHPHLREAQARSVNYVISVWKQAVDAGQLQGDPETMAHLAWASIHGLLSLHVANLLGFGRDLDSLIEPLLQMFLPGAAATPRRKAAKRKS